MRKVGVERMESEWSRMSDAAPVLLRSLTPMDLQRINEWLQDDDIQSLYEGVAPRRHRMARAWGIWRDKPFLQESPSSTVTPPSTVSLAASAAASDRQGSRIDLQPMIGWVEIDDINRRAASAELRVCVGRKDLWGRGYGAAAVRLAIEQGFQHLKLREIYLRVATDNARAIAAYRKCGFAAEGILRAGRHAALGMRDHFLMTLRRPREG